jgi:hypothetical protein
MRRLTDAELLEASKSLRKVDTRGTKAPHARHLATINHVAIPGFNSGPFNGVLGGEIAITSCGKVLKNYWDASQTSPFFTDGTVYSMPCKTCLPSDHATVAKATNPQAEGEEVRENG